MFVREIVKIKLFEFISFTDFKKLLILSFRIILMHKIENSNDGPQAMHTIPTIEGFKVLFLCKNTFSVGIRNMKCNMV